MKAQKSGHQQSWPVIHPHYHRCNVATSAAHIFSTQIHLFNPINPNHTILEQIIGQMISLIMGIQTIDPNIISAVGVRHITNDQRAIHRLRIALQRLKIALFLRDCFIISTHLTNRRRTRKKNITIGRNKRDTGKQAR